ncbi:MAG: hypothetical protein KJN93_10390 [Alphaproteobacteria bacterium]|nr:hypothetical protein [Alphaproteobacteria bacterium]
MRNPHACLALCAGIWLAACAPIENASRLITDPAVPAELVDARDYRVTQLEVRVPRELTVSEANLYYPLADIVWREDPFGDRYDQVEAILRPAAERATGGLAGQRPVGVAIELVRFHALSEKARFSVGGVHSVHFRMSILDPDTGAEIEPTRLVIADLEAYGGERAMAAVREGRTQKARISNHLAGVIQHQLIAPIKIVSSDPL